MPDPFPPAPPETHTFRFHIGAGVCPRTEWWFNLDTGMVFAATGCREDEKADDKAKDGKKKPKPEPEVARTVMDTPQLLRDFKTTGGMVPNGGYDDKGNLLIEGVTTVAIAKNKDAFVENARVERETYLKRGNGVWGGAILVVEDSNNNNTYDEGEPIEIILSGAYDEDYNQAILGFDYDYKQHKFVADLEHTYSWQPDSHGGGNFAKADFSVGSKKKLIKN